MMKPRGIAEDFPRPLGVNSLHGRARFAPDPADLAVRPALSLGTATVSPATRKVRGPGGETMLEPRVMQVLLALADADGAVVTRAGLVDACWGGRFVGEDAVSRAIAEARRALRRAGADDVVIETIPKIGYRLERPIGSIAPAADTATSVPQASLVSRRVLIAGGVAATAVAGVLPWHRPSPRAAEAAALLTRGRAALRDELPDSDQQGIGFLERAVALEPGNAAAWGTLALAWRNTTEFADIERVAAASARSEQAARRALSIDNRQGDALAALATLPPTFGDWTAAEQRLRRVLAVVPDNAAALDALGKIEMGTGRVRARLAIARRLAASDPLSPAYQWHLTYGLWATGHAAEADRTVARAFQLWPAHPAIWMARLWTLAFSGRAEAALALVNETQQRQGAPSRTLTTLATSLRALASRAPADIAAAVDANLAVARLGGLMAVNAMQFLSGLGAVDEAFAVADAYLLQRGPIAMAQLQAPSQAKMNDARHRKTMMLFTVTTTAMRKDRRFLPLCNDIGLVDYWRKTGKLPDFLEGRLLI